MDALDLDLEQLVPQGGEFTLASTGHAYRLKPFTVADEIWLKQTFGDEVQAIFSEMRMKDLCRIAFRLMELDDQRTLKAQDVTFIDEAGDELKIRMGGAELLCSLVSGIHEKLELLKAILQTIGVSRPMLEEMTGEAQKKTPRQATKPVGRKSSTSSVRNTDGLRNTSSRARSGKSTGGSGRSARGGK